MRNKERSEINYNTRRYYLNHKKECSFFNWVARLTAYLDFGKRVYPTPSIKEVEAFYVETGYKRKRWKK